MFTRNTDRHSRRTEGTRRVASANRVLSFRRIKLAEWQGTSCVVSNATGASTMFESFSHLWPEAESLCGRDIDPLDDALIDWMQKQ